MINTKRVWMRKIKGSGSCFKKQVTVNLTKAALSMTLTIVSLLVEVYVVLFTRQFTFYKLSGFIFVVISFIVFHYYLHKYRVYSGGWRGEKQVIKLLGNGLSDNTTKSTTFT
jgi:hypothetical protein